MRVLPVPVTALSQTVAIDIPSTPMLTIRMTGMASATNDLSRPNTLRNSSGKRLSSMQRNNVKLKLSFTDLPDESLHFIFFPLANDIADHGIAGAGKGPYKYAKEAKDIPHRITDRELAFTMMFNQDIK